MAELDRDPVYERRSHMRGEQSGQYMGETGWLCKCGYVNGLDKPVCDRCHSGRNEAAHYQDYLAGKEFDPRD